jgi:hypothetical protein
MMAIPHKDLQERGAFEPGFAILLQGSSTVYKADGFRVI